MTRRSVPHSGEFAQRENGKLADRALWGGDFEAVGARAYARRPRDGGRDESVLAGPGDPPRCAVGGQGLGDVDVATYNPSLFSSLFFRL